MWLFAPCACPMGNRKPCVTQGRTEHAGPAGRAAPRSSSLPRGAEEMGLGTIPRDLHRVHRPPEKLPLCQAGQGEVAERRERGPRVLLAGGTARMGTGTALPIWGHRGTRSWGWC